MLNSLAGPALKEIYQVFFTANILLIKDHLNLKVFNFFQVLGNAKGAVAVVVSILIFKNPISFIGMAGYGLTVIGVVMYSEAKKKYR